MRSRTSGTHDSSHVGTSPTRSHDGTEIRHDRELPRHQEERREKASSNPFETTADRTARARPSSRRLTSCARRAHPPSRGRRSRARRLHVVEDRTRRSRRNPSPTPEPQMCTRAEPRVGADRDEQMATRVRAPPSSLVRPWSMANRTIAAPRHARRLVHDHDEERRRLAIRPQHQPEAPDDAASSRETVLLADGAAAPWSAAPAAAARRVRHRQRSRRPASTAR